jgi:hypothetical protein
MDTFPKPPQALSGAPRAFYDELRQMLELVQPSKLDTQRSSARFDADGVDVSLGHVDRDDWKIWASVGERDAIVSTGWAHEHFFPGSPAEEEERSWTTAIVDFIAEILRGEIETETTFRGKAAISVRHLNIDENGEWALLGRTFFPVPARLLLWRPKRTETERLSFS